MNAQTVTIERRKDHFTRAYMDMQLVLHQLNVRLSKIISGEEGPFSDMELKLIKNSIVHLLEKSDEALLNK